MGENAERLQSKDDAASQMERIVAGKATFDDFLEQTKMMASMGNLQNVAKMMPGMGGLDQSKLSEAEARIKVQESLIMSMTPAERRDPRRRRVAALRQRVPADAHDDAEDGRGPEPQRSSAINGRRARAEPRGAADEEKEVEREE